MRKVLLLMLTAIVCATVNAEPISRQQAQQKAAAFLKQQKPQAKLATTAITKAPRRVNGQIVSDQAYYYVFNTENNQGYVIASGDDVAIPILAYSKEGTFDEENIPDGLQYMLDGYAKEIAWAQENGITATAPRKAKEGRTSISHLVSAKWGQSSPYNTQCVVTKNNRSYTCMTGCVATAMAQVLYYWGKTKGYSDISSTAIPEYTTSSSSYTASALAARTFNWSSMTDSPTSSNGSEVAFLMRYCGQAVEMDYGISESGAYDNDVPYGLKQYFSLSKAARYIDRYNYTDEEWDEIIYKELEAGRPVIYGGVDSSYGGHCFVCDGYDSSTEKFYFNWGWEGTGNSTLCALSALNVSNGNTNYKFNYNQDAIVNVKPEALETEEEVALASNLTLSAFKMVSESNLKRASRTEECPLVEMMGVVFNYSGMELDLETAFQVYNEEGELVDIVGYDYESMEAKGGSYYLKSFTFGAEMPYGKYKIYPVCRIEGATEWNLLDGASDKYVEVELEDNGTDVIVKPAYALKVEVSQVKSGSSIRPTYTTTLNITNIGCETFDGYIFAIIDNNFNNYKTVEVSNLAPGASTSQTITYNYDISSASHTLFVTMEGYLALYTNSTTSDFGFWNLYWLNSAGDYKLIGNNYEFVAQFVNMGDAEYSGVVSATLFEKGTSESSGETKTVNLSIKPGQVVDSEFSFSNVTYGKTYSLKLVFGGITYYLGAEGTNNSTTKTYYNPTYAFTMAKGMTILSEENKLQRILDTEELPSIPETSYYVDARCSDKAASLSGGRTNTVFLLKEGATIPEALASKNVVVGSTAENITISDDEEFYTPADFTATNVTYKRTFDEGCDADNAHWSTIMLPFKAESVTCGDETLDWYRSAEDVDKNFWLLDFTSEENDEAQFTYAESLEANHPYIIAVPSNAWGEKWNLTGKELTFTGLNAEFKAYMPHGVVDNGGKYDFIGRTYLTGQVDKYCMNDEGNEFEYVSDGWMFYAFPFRGYFVAYYDLGEESNVVLDMPSPLPTAIATLIGDVNKDGKIDVADITALTNILVNGDEANVFDHYAADVNQADGLTSADISALVDLVLKKVPQQAVPKRSAARKGQRMQNSQMRQGLSKLYPSMRKKEGVKLNNIGTLRPNTLHKK